MELSEGTVKSDLFYFYQRSGNYAMFENQADCLNQTDDCFSRGDCTLTNNYYVCKCVSRFDPMTNCNLNFFVTYNGVEDAYIAVRIVWINVQDQNTGRVTCQARVKHYFDFALGWFFWLGHSHVRILIRNWE